MTSPQLLEKQVEKALTVLGQRQKGGARHFPMERDIVMLFGMWRGWSNTMLARMLGVHPRSVYRYRMRLWENPSLIFLCPVLHKALKGKRVVWTCLFCGNPMTSTEEQAREHVASHVTTVEIIAMKGVIPEDAARAQLERDL